MFITDSNNCEKKSDIQILIDEINNYKFVELKTAKTAILITGKNSMNRAINAVPEPATMLLFAIGFIGLSIIIKKKNISQYFKSFLKNIGLIYKYKKI